MRASRRVLTVAAGILALGASAPAYYHFLHYANGSGVPIPEKFSVAALPEKTVRFFVQGAPTKVADGDSFAAVLSELRLAGQVWNGVATSDLRVAYGGFAAPETPQSAPHIDVIFSDDIPPGVLAEAGPTSRTDITDDGAGAYVPIVRSEVRLRSDLSDRRSSSSGFFLTAVHELGHALGLQHTFTSSVMSTDATRASTKGSPLGADDTAAISALYPNAYFAAWYGSISGRVEMGGAGVHMASVIALKSNGQAVSALTNPDGTYRIDGLRGGDYYLYVHALPPAAQSDLGESGGPADIVLPLDGDGKPIAAGDPFATLFYPGTQDAKQANLVNVKAGAKTEDINFTVQKHAAPGLYGVTTYSFPGNVAAKPAYINLSESSVAKSLVVAWGNGLMNGTTPAPGLSVSMLGSGTLLAQDGVRPYSADNSFLQINFRLTPFSGSGPRHMIFSTPNDLYVLPSAMTLVDRQPPSIASVEAAMDENGNRTVVVTGSKLGNDTRILFDGVAATVLSVDAAQGKVVVTPPPAPVNYRSDVVALNGDGQPSLFLGPAASFTYTWGPSDAAALSLSADSLPAGVESMIEITATNMTLVPGRTWVGFGSADVVVKDVWVVSPTLVRANVFVLPNAQPSDTVVSVTSGFQTAVIPAGFHVRSSLAAPLSLSSDVESADASQPWVYPGGTALLPVHGLRADAAVSSLTLTFNGVRVPVAAINDGKLVFRVPESLAPGPVVARLAVAGMESQASVFLTIQKAPPVIESVTSSSGDGAAHPDSVLTIAVLNVGGEGVAVSRDQIHLTIGGVDHSLSGSAEALADRPKVHVMRTYLNASVEAGEKVPVVVTFQGQWSQAFFISVVK